MRKLLLPLFLLLYSSAFADQIVYPTIWGTNDVVTAVKLNNNNNAVSSVVNGNLDNGNMKSGYSLFQTVSSLPSAGSQGRVDFLTSDNSLNLDTGAAWIKTITPSGTLAIGQIPLYNASWGLLSPGTVDYSLISNGSSSLPSYRQVPLATGVSGLLPDSNIAQITTASKVSGSSITGLASLPSGAGIIPTANLPALGSMVLISTTTLTSQPATTGNISITSGNTYFVQFNFNNFSGGAPLGLRFNADSGSNYKYVNAGLTADSATFKGAVSSGTTAIQIGRSVASASNGGISGGFYIQQIGSSSQIYRIWGQTSQDDAVGTLGMFSFGGQWSNSANVTSFVMFPNVAFTGMDGVVYLYQVKTS